MNYLNERELLNTVSQIRSHLDLKEEGELQGCRREPEPTASKSMVLQQQMVSTTCTDLPPFTEGQALTLQNGCAVFSSLFAWISLESSAAAEPADRGTIIFSLPSGTVSQTSYAFSASSDGPLNTRTRRACHITEHYHFQVNSLLFLISCYFIDCCCYCSCSCSCSCLLLHLVQLHFPPNPHLILLLTFRIMYLFLRIFKFDLKFFQFISKLSKNFVE